MNIVSLINRGNNMKKRIQQLFCGIVVILGIFCYAHIAKEHCIYDRAIDASAYKATTFYAGEIITQRFFSSENTLDGITIKSRITGDVKDIKVKYALRDVQTKKDVAKGQVSGANFKDSKFFEFSFDTIQNCKNKEYEFVLEEIGNSSENYIDFCYIDKQENDTELTMGKENVQGTLVMKTITNRFDVETFCVLLLFVIYIIVFVKFLYRLFK